MSLAPIDASRLLDIGFAALVAVLLLFWMQRIIAKLWTVIESNTMAMQRMADVSESVTRELANHDRHISSSVDAIQRIDSGVARMESKIDQALTVVGNRQTRS